MKINADAVAIWGVGTNTNADSSAGYSSLASVACSSVTISNQTGVDIEIVKGTSGDGFIMPDTAIITFPVIADASEIGWRREDEAAVSSTITYYYAL